MRIVSLLFLMALAACSPSDPNTKDPAAFACDVDGSLQPVAASEAAKLVPGATASVVIELDQLLVHPAVVKFCADRGGTPVAPAKPAS